MKNTPFVSVIVPCRNEAAYLGPCLDSILECGYPPDSMEILVADGMSQDGTRELLRSYGERDPRVRLIDNPRRTTPAALNRAMANARGEIIVRVDSHSTISRGYLEGAVDALASSGASNVGGLMRTATRDNGPFAEPIRIALTSRFGVGNSAFRTLEASHGPQWVDTVFGGCWPRDVFERIGVFNGALERSQDIEFNLRLRRAGGKILLTPAIESVYYAKATLSDFLWRNWSNGLWSILPFVYASGIPVRWRHLVPLAFVGALLGVTLAGTPALVAGPYLAANLSVSAVHAWQLRQARLLVLLPVAFASLHVAYGLGSLNAVIRLPWLLARKLFSTTSP